MGVSECFDRPTVEDLTKCIKVEYEQRVLGGRKVPPGDVIDFIAPIMAGAAWQMYGDIEKIVRQNVFLKDMCCDQLRRMAECIGCPLLPARSARGWIEINGTPGTVIPDTIEFVSVQSQVLSFNYVVDPLSSPPDVIPESGTAAILVTSSVPGASTNLAGGTQVTLTGAITGIDAAAFVSAGGVAGGTDEETCEELRARLIARRREACVAGNRQWYDTQIRKFPGVTRVCFNGCQCNQCCDSSHIVAYVFMDNIAAYENGVPPKSVLEDIADFVFGDPQGAGLGLAPIGATGEFLCAQPCPVTVTVQNLTNTNKTLEDGIRAAIVDYFENVSCPGESICGLDLAQAIRQTFPELCFSGVTITGDCVEAINNGRDFQLECGYFPLLDNLVLGVI